MEKKRVQSHFRDEHPIKQFTRKFRSTSISYLSEGLQQVAARNRQSDVYMVHNEERLLLALVWKTGKVVCYKQQHVHLRFLKEKKPAYN